MLEADHIYAVRRSFESRAMPETEKLPAKPVDIYSKDYLDIRDFTKKRIRRKISNTGIPI